MFEVCGDNRFEVIEKAKKHLLESTNIETSQDEMNVLDNFLFRCWQMGWLNKYDPTVKTISEKECGNCDIWKQLKERKSDWISPSDMLPKDGQQAWIAFQYRKGGIGVTEKPTDTETINYGTSQIHKGVWEITNYLVCEVIAWMPIEPYTGDKE